MDRADQGAGDADLRRIPFAKPDVGPDVLDACRRVLESGWLTTGPEVGRFEQDVADLVQVPHAVAVSSCTAALEIGLRCLRLPPGSRVLTSTMTFSGAVHAIIHAGLRPVLVDIDPATGMPTAETTWAARRRAGGADAMVVTHYAGHPAAIGELAQGAGLPPSRIVEDAAHALGARIDGRLLGGESAATCFSFYATKNLPIGEGGMLTTNDPELASAARRVRLHGMSDDAWKRYLPGGGWRYEVAEDGLKANLTDLAAAIGRAQLSHFAAWQELRTSLASAYDARLANIDGLSLPARPAAGHAWHLYVIRVEERFPGGRDGLIGALAEGGVDCSVHFIPIHHHRYFRPLLEGARLPGADRMFRQIVSLPLYPALGLEGVDRVSQEIRARINGALR